MIRNHMRTIRFGLVGTGRITDWVLRGAVLDPRFRAEAVCSRTEEAARRFAEGHGIPRIFTDVDAMAADPDIDAVYIGTPNHTHHDLAIRCMRHGKHVLCEKPLASNAREAAGMAQAARENGVLLMEAMISALTPNFLRARQALGELGALRRYSAFFCQYSSKYDLLRQILAGASDAPVPSSFNPSCAGGALMDVGIYTLYPMIALLGEPQQVRAAVQTCLVPTASGPMRIDLQGSAVCSYDGLEATASWSKTADSRLATELSCEKGILLLDQIHITRSVSLVRRGAPTSGRTGGPAAEDISVPVDADEYLCEFREFIDTLEQGRTESARNSLQVSVSCLRVMDAIRAQAGVVFPADA